MKQNKMYAVIMLEVAKRSTDNSENYNKNYKNVMKELKELFENWLIK